MKLECSILSHPLPCNAKAIGKAAKGFVCIGKGKLKPSNGTFHLQISTAKARNQPAVTLSPENITAFLTTFAAQGKVTIDFASPASRLFINGANPDRLRRFIEIVNKIRNREEVNLHEVEKVSSTDFQKQKTLKVENSKSYFTDYAKNFPTAINELGIVNCGLSKFDIRWFSCVNLVSIDLSHNKLGSVPTELNKFRLLARLKMLKSLDLSHNNLESLPVDAVLPESLLEVNLSSNAFKWIPMVIKKCRRLRSLKLSRNPIKELPITNHWPFLKVFDVSHTEINHFPSYIVRWKLDTFFFSDLNVPTERYEAELHVIDDKFMEIARLESIAMAAVRTARIPETMLPWTVAIAKDELAMECSFCKKWSASEMTVPVLQSVNAMSVANQVDSNRDILVKIQRCPTCLRKGYR